MKEDIREILVRHSDNKKVNDAIETDLLILFDAIFSDFNEFGKKTKTKKGKTDCRECKFNDKSSNSACFSCLEKVGFGYHYR